MFQTYLNLKNSYFLKGPVIFYNVTSKETILAGIISFSQGITRDDHSFPDVHVRISKFYKWIMETNVSKKDNIFKHTITFVTEIDLNYLIDNLVKTPTHSGDY